MPDVAASDDAAELERPLTVARPLAEETQSTVPPNAWTRDWKSAGAVLVKETICRPVPGAALLPTSENDGARRVDAGGVDGGSAQAVNTATAQKLERTTRCMVNPSCEVEDLRSKDSGHRRAWSPRRGQSARELLR